MKKLILIVQSIRFPKMTRDEAEKKLKKIFGFEFAVINIGNI